MDNIRFLNLEYLFLLAYRFFTGESATTIPQSAFEIFRIVQWVGLAAVLLLVVFILYSMRGIRKTQRKHLHGFEEARSVRFKEEGDEEINKNEEKFERIMEHVSSANSNDWRFAILEADIMLGDMLVSLGYQGETVGEILKSVERGDLTTLDLAWEAHKIRNDVAHGGAEFHLSQREAKRVIDLYGQVFEEAEYI